MIYSNVMALICMTFLLFMIPDYQLIKVWQNTSLESMYVTPDISGVRIEFSGVAAQPLGAKIKILGAAAQPLA